MIALQIATRKFDLDDDLQGYVERKLAKLDRYFPRHHQPTALKVEISRDESVAPDKRYHISVQLTAPQHQMHAETATMNPHSAVDIIEAKLKDQIRKYKDKHAPKRLTLKRLLPSASASEQD